MSGASQEVAGGSVTRGSGCGTAMSQERPQPAGYAPGRGPNPQTVCSSWWAPTSRWGGRGLRSTPAPCQPPAGLFCPSSCLAPWQPQRLRAEGDQAAAPLPPLSPPSRANRDVRRPAAPPLCLSLLPQVLQPHPQGPEVGAAAQVRLQEGLPRVRGWRSPRVSSLFSHVDLAQWKKGNFLRQCWGDGIWRNPQLLLKPLSSFLCLFQPSLVGYRNFVVLPKSAPRWLSAGKT